MVKKQETKVKKNCDIDRNRIKLTNEQQKMIRYAKEGHNVLVDACIGSGKTTSIQELCNVLSENKRILYLTYNKLLKFDAQNKIKNNNVYVTNYNSYVYRLLKENNIKVGVSEQLEVFFKYKFKDKNKYDLLIIDEYQDIDSEHEELLEHIKSENKGLQIVAVGDECQKIYDYSRSNAVKFIKSFLRNYKKVSYTKCFRLSKEYATRIGKIWNKKIVGCNKECKVEEMAIDEVINFLKNQDPSSILCLGANNKNSKRHEIQNRLEKIDNRKFGKYTLYSSIADEDDGIKIDSKTAIFTTYDKCKGLERDICVICDFTENYWNSRICKPMQRYDILRNIFCVAMSRGKSHIIFVKEGSKLLADKMLKKKVRINKDFKDYRIHNLFDYKYKDDIKECYKCIKCSKIRVNSNDIIKIKKNDGKIDLSPCIGIYQECKFFKKYNIDSQIEYVLKGKDKNIQNNYHRDNEQRKILYLTSLETGQKRYRDVKDYIDNKQKKAIFNRLKTEFNRNEDVQIDTSMYFKAGKRECAILGRIDVLKNGIIWEIKFVNELKMTDFLQCAMYMVSMNKKKGILWNTMNNEKYEITIPNKKKFLNSVVFAITKGEIKEYKK